MLLGAFMLTSLAGAVEVTSDDGDTTLTLEGYYRLRVHHFSGLYDPSSERWRDESGAGRYSTQRLQLRPSINFSDRATFFMQAEAFNNTLMGDNEDLSSTAVFAGTGGNTGVDGQPGQNFAVQRAWTKFSTPAGTVLAGRMASHWGMGLLANDGNGFRNNWGEAYNGSTFDRIMFATKPLAITQAAFGVGNADLPLIFAVGIDRLVEDPLKQYYGTRCNPNDPDDGCADDADNDWTEERDPSQRRDNWWTDNDDDVWQIAYVLAYRGEDLDWGGHSTDFSLGGLAFNRHQRETHSSIWVMDAHTKLRQRWMYVESEGYAILGQSRAIALPDYGETDPLAKKVNIWGAAARTGYLTPGLDIILEGGIASGDDQYTDANFTGRSFQSDYNVGLILYEEILSRVSRYQWGDAADGLWSNGGVYNSKYLFPQVRYQLIPGWNLHAAFLVAAPHRPDGAVIAKAEDSESAILGWEVDAALKIDFQEQMRFSLEGAYAQVSDRIPNDVWGLAADDQVWTVQSRIAYEF
jgi:hypothetical protein